MVPCAIVSPGRHFRAHGRRPVQLPVILRGVRGEWERAARVIDITLAGAGLETEEPLVAGERVMVSFATPTLWDPLVLGAVVAWAHPIGTAPGTDPLGRPRRAARSGLVFDYTTPDTTLAMFDMLAAVGFE